MKKFNKIISGALAALMIFTSVPVYAVNDVSTGTNTEISTETEENTSETISNGTEEIIDLSEISTEETATTENPVIEDKPTVFVESDENLEETDNWELGVVFYDSTVENGTKPLTEINWDASDGGYKEGTPRIITVQINYKNTNAVTTYQPGDLKITIPNITYNNTSVGKDSAQWKASVIVGANDPSHTGYPWNFNNGKYAPSATSQYYYFYNAETIEEKSNFEGSIQIEYTITPAKDSPERYEDECIHTTNQSITYELTYPQILDDLTNQNITLSSNSISFNYTRTYIHKWEKASTTFTKKAVKITSYDGLGENAQAYIWVKYLLHPYSIEWTTSYGAMVRPIKYQNAIIYDDIPSECKVYDSKGNLLTSNNGTYIFEGKDFYDSTSAPNAGSSVGGKTIYVGYPKSIYNEENNNLIITNTAYLYGKYDGELDQDYQYLNTASVTVNLSEFDFTYTGDLYSLSKVKNYSINPFTYQEIVNNWPYNSTSWSIYPTVIYIGKKVTVKIGDDLLYATNNEGKYEKLNDDEYCFNKISLGMLKNGNGLYIEEGKYNCELWVRYANEKDYVLFDSFKNTSKYLNSSDFAKPVVGYYFIIYDLEESITNNSYSSCSIKFFKNNIPESGQLHNFAYMQTFFRDENDNLILQNEPDIDSYANYITKEEIANYDIATYETYMQRATACASWYYYKVNPIDKFYARKFDGTITQDIKNEEFTTTFSIGTRIENTSELEERYYQYISKDNFITGFQIYDLLPEGMTLTSSKEEILKSVLVDKSIYSSALLFDSNFNKLTKADFKKIIQNNHKINITENWRNTNRTRIEIIVDFKDNPILFLGEDHGSGVKDRFDVTYKYNVKIPYDSYFEYGSVWENNVYVDNNDRDKVYSFGNATTDNGKYDIQESDINANNTGTDSLSYATSSITINSIISTFQDVQTQTSSTLSNYSTGTVPAEYGKDYSYKLRVRTGQNDVTNLIIYDNLEKWAKDKDGNFIEAAGKKKYWQGEFQSIDTSYAESKGYNVKVWYSENEKAGTLAEDSSWKEYIWPTLITDSEKTVTITSPNWPNNYPANMTETNNYWEQSFDGAESIQITFDSTSKLESASYDYLRFYDRNGKNITNDLFGITAGKIGSSDLAGKIVIVPGNYVKITMRTDGSGQYKGFSAQLSPMISVPVIDDSKIKSLAFQYLDTEGNPAVLPANSSTYVEINMKAPADESITTFAYNGCWTQWNALDEFGQPVDFITGINSNIVKVALPNSVIENEIPSIQLNIEKEIQGTSEAFKNMQLDPDGEYQFMISLVRQEENEDGSHDVINGIISNKKGIVINDLSYGTWLITESDDTYFDLVEIISMDDPEIMTPGVTFEKTDAGYMLTIDENIDSATEYSLKVINEIEPKKYYEDKDSETNIFKGIPIIEEQSLVDKLINIFE